jgi:endonuclease/exonuclease/phosphatase (EEP) superfamily protein YafD
MRAMVVVALAACGAAESAPAELRLVTYNLNFGNPDVERTLAAIEAANADVALLQEVTPAWEALLRKRFAASYPHLTFHVPAGHAGHAMLSKFRFVTDEKLTKPAGAFYHGHRAVLATPNGKLQILHVHLRASIHDDCFRGPCTKVEWVKGQFTTPPIRLREIQTHWKSIDAKLPTLVAGDFNEPVGGDVIAFLEKQGLTRVPSKGLPTWHYAPVIDGQQSDMLSSDIDHVLVDQRITAIDATVLDAGASDHRPVVARLQIR